jgi:hypothetical protein
VAAILSACSSLFRERKEPDSQIHFDKKYLQLTGDGMSMQYKGCTLLFVLLPELQRWLPVGDDVSFSLPFAHFLSLSNPLAHYFLFATLSPFYSLRSLRSFTSCALLS